MDSYDWGTLGGQATQPMQNTTDLAHNSTLSSLVAPLQVRSVTAPGKGWEQSPWPAQGHGT